MKQLEPELPVVQRNAVRLVVLDRGGHILLFRIHEPMHPEQGICWELPGGGIGLGETVAAAAARELREETGVIVDTNEIDQPTWWRRAAFKHAGQRRVQDEAVVRVQLRLDKPVVTAGEQLEDEQATYFGFHWWTVREIESSGRSSEDFGALKCRPKHSAELPQLGHRSIRGNSPFRLPLLKDLQQVKQA